jgi:hypothetical protein
MYNSNVERNKYDLGFRKSVNAIELTHYQILGKKFKTHITSFDLYDPASEWVFNSGLMYGSTKVGGYTPKRGGYTPGVNSPLFPFEFTPIFTGVENAIISVEGRDINGQPVDADELVTFKTNDVESDDRLQGVIDISANGNPGYVIFKFLITVDGQTSLPQYLVAYWRITELDIDPFSVDADWTFDPNIMYGATKVGGYRPTRGGYNPGTNSPIYPITFTPFFKDGERVEISVLGKNINGVDVAANELVVYDYIKPAPYWHFHATIDISANNNTGTVIFQFSMKPDGQALISQYLAVGWV